MWEMLFLHYFPGLSLADFNTPNGFQVERWEIGKALITQWQKRGM